VPTNASKKLTPKKPAEPHFVSTPKAHVAAKTETVAFASPPTAPAQFNGSIAAPQGPRGITSYRIEQGDKSWENVARSFNTSAAEIRSLNMMTNSDLPAVGSEIIVPSPGPVSL
jgi:flagellar hook-length control protein FliK